MGIETGKINYLGSEITYDQLRNSITSMNSFNDLNSYKNTNLLGKTSQYLNVIPQLSGIVNLNNTFLGRGLGATPIGNSLGLNAPTDLEKIGTIMLIKQFSYSSVSHLAQQYLPSINVKSIFNGGDLFSFPVDNVITKNSNNNWLQNIASKAFFNMPSKESPLPKNSTNDDLLNNTGTGQLTNLFKNINNNLYKPINDANSKLIAINLNNKAFKNIPLTLKSNVLYNNNKTYFNFNENPYIVNATLYSTTNSISIANTDMIISNSIVGTQEYAPSIEYVNNNFGKTDKTPINNSLILNDFVNSNDNENIKNKLVWGRDGVENNTIKLISQLHGNTDAEVGNYETSTLLETQTDFNIKTGLLEYTRNLVNATSGHFVDNTRKAFKNGNDIVGFNGSPLWQANDSTYANYSNIGGMTGVRQHTIIDQYDRYAKAIRFNGNRVYAGNPNSVIYDSVMPRIHPTRDTNNFQSINNKNLMFSIENLAISVIKDPTGDYGIIDDELGSPIPVSEVGPFNGRIMWFPPYDIKLNEVANAKYESTVLIGRNEPMYNYMNSERSANLSFILLVDHPQTLSNYLNDSNYKKNVADFFAFGGDQVNSIVQINAIQLRIDSIKKQIEFISGPKDTTNPQLNENVTFSIYFPNNIPKAEDNLFETINYLYNTYQADSDSNIGYEIAKNVNTTNSDGLNEKIYFISGITQSGAEYIRNNSNVEQYNVNKISEQNIGSQTNGTNYFNKTLSDYFTNKDLRQYYDIQIIGYASLLYEIKSKEAKYNYDLGLRRANSAKNFLIDRLSAIFPDTNINDFNILDVISMGSTTASQEGADSKNINNLIVKSDRRADIIISANGKTISSKNINDSSDVQKLKAELAQLELLLQQQKNSINNVNDNIYNKRGYESKSTLNTFENVQKNYYTPTNFSQTPEEFHRRLTFLQQCVRQGASLRYDNKDANGVISAKNSVFGRQPICILRYGDFLYTKVVIESITIDYDDVTWDMNPEGFGLQPMMAKINLQMKIIGGQSLKGPIDALQNAVSFNFYANSSFSKKGMYKLPSDVADAQESYINGVLTDKVSKLEGTGLYKKLIKNTKEQNNGS